LASVIFPQKFTLANRRLTPAGLVYAFRDEFFTRARLTDDEDVHVVDTRGKIDVLPNSLYQLRLADGPVYQWRTVYILFFSI